MYEYKMNKISTRTPRYCKSALPLAGKEWANEMPHYSIVRMYNAHSLSCSVSNERGCKGERVGCATVGINNQRARPRDILPTYHHLCGYTRIIPIPVFGRSKLYMT